jgi:hypothetical protein
MRLRFVAMAFVVLLSVVAVYNVCHEQGGAIDTIVGMARRITYGALFAIGFCTASLVLRKWMSQPLRPICPNGQAVPPPPVPTFGMSQPGTGKFRVSGVDHDTRFQTSEIVYADSPGSAKLKVELKGVDVQTVEPV